MDLDQARQNNDPDLDLMVENLVVLLNAFSKKFILKKWMSGQLNSCRHHHAYGLERKMLRDMEQEVNFVCLKYNR